MPRLRKRGARTAKAKAAPPRIDVRNLETEIKHLNSQVTEALRERVAIDQRIAALQQKIAAIERTILVTAIKQAFTAAPAPPVRNAETKWLDGERLLTIKQAAEMTTLSVDTLKAEYPHLLLKLTPRRYGIRLRDVIAIGG